MAIARYACLSLTQYRLYLLPSIEGRIHKHALPLRTSPLANTAPGRKPRPKPPTLHTYPLNSLPQGRSMMISMAMILKKLADEHNLSVLVTNHMVAGNGAPKPALGVSWKAVPHVRLVITRDRGSNMCTATVLKHTLLASGRRMKFVVPG